MGIDWKKYCKLWIEIDIEHEDMAATQARRSLRRMKGRGGFISKEIIRPPKNHGNWKFS
jgi:hypothetical protein